MPSKLYRLGLSPCCELFKVVASDYDGTDLIETVKTEISDILDRGDSVGHPVPFYLMGGVLGDLHVDTFILYVYGGVPLILTPDISMEGGGRHDGRLVAGNMFIAGMYADNNRSVFSLGYIDPDEDAYAYAVQYTRKNPLVKDATISEDTAALYIASNPDSAHMVGTIQRVGGSVFEVYAFSGTESSLIRADKDFVGGEPYAQNGIPHGKIEVILYGGDPAIVPVGAICTPTGDFLTVWVPNDTGFIECTSNMLKCGDIPVDGLYVDYEDIADAYEMYADKLISDEEEADMEAESDDIPSFDYDEFYSDDEPVRV